MRARADRVVFNDAPKYGSVGPEFIVGGESCPPMRIWTDGAAAINFAQLRWTPAFSALATREQLLDKLNAIPDVAIPGQAGILPDGGPNRRTHRRVS